MLATIGLTISAYVVLRCAEPFDLPRLATRILAAIVLLVALANGYVCLTFGSSVTPEMPAFSTPAPGGPYQFPK